MPRNSTLGLRTKLLEEKEEACRVPSIPLCPHIWYLAQRIHIVPFLLLEAKSRCLGGPSPASAKQALYLPRSPKSSIRGTCHTFLKVLLPESLVFRNIRLANSRPEKSLIQCWYLADGKGFQRSSCRLLECGQLCLSGRKTNVRINKHYENESDRKAGT